MILFYFYYKDSKYLNNILYNTSLLPCRTCYVFAWFSPDCHAHPCLSVLFILMLCFQTTCLPWLARQTSASTRMLSCPNKCNLLQFPDFHQPMIHYTRDGLVKGKQQEYKVIKIVFSSLTFIFCSTLISLDFKHWLSVSCNLSHTHITLWGKYNLCVFNI